MLIVAMIVGVGFETLSIGLVVPVVTAIADIEKLLVFPIIKQLYVDLGQPEQRQITIYASIGLMLVYGIRTCYLAFLAWFQLRFAFNVQGNLSKRLFEVYLQQPYQFHLHRNSADLIRNAVSDINLFTFNCLITGMSFLTEIFVLVSIGSLLVYMEPFGALIVAGGLGGLAMIFHVLTKNSLVRWGELRQEHEGRRIQHLQQGLGGAKVVKLLGREQMFIDLYDLHTRKSIKAARYQQTLGQMPRLFIEFFAVAGLVLMIVILLIQGRELASIIPTLGLFAAAAFRLMPSVNRVLTSIQSMRFGLAVIDTLIQEVNLPTDHQELETHSISFTEKIEFNCVSFSYKGAEVPALQEVSFELKRGNCIGIIGSSGAGKSTLVDLLLGLIEPSSGEILVDGKPIKGALRDWGARIGYVPQHIYLTDDSLRNNIAFGISPEDIDDAVIHRALEDAQLAEFVDSLPEGIETQVGERGVRLSGGQRQRIGIARALYNDPPLLVLDEASSALDLVTEAEVMSAVTRLQGEKTIVIVAHRLSTVASCDEILRLDNGKLIERGLPNQVLSLKSSETQGIE